MVRRKGGIQADHGSGGLGVRETAFVCRDSQIKSLGKEWTEFGKRMDWKDCANYFFQPPVDPRVHEGLDYRYNSGRSRLAERSNVKTCQEVKGVGASPVSSLSPYVGLTGSVGEGPFEPAWVHHARERVTFANAVHSRWGGQSQTGLGMDPHSNSM